VGLREGSEDGIGGLDRRPMGRRTSNQSRGDDRRVCGGGATRCRRRAGQHTGR
jgi:hypothetical protein